MQMVKRYFIGQQEEYPIFNPSETTSPLKKREGYYPRKSKSIEICLDRNLSLEDLMALIESLQGKAEDFLKPYERGNNSVGGRRYKLRINIQVGLIAGE